MITSHQGGNTSFSNCFNLSPISNTEMFGLGGELTKEVAFVFIFFYYFGQAHFVMFSGLLGPLSIKLLYYTAYFFFQNLDLFCNQNFLWFCLSCKLEN